MAQFNENGDLVFISRIDDQINICGNRIEIGEIENAILEFKRIIGHGVHQNFAYICDF